MSVSPNVSTVDSGVLPVLNDCSFSNLHEEDRSTDHTISDDSVDRANPGQGDLSLISSSTGEPGKHLIEHHAVECVDDSLHSLSSMDISAEYNATSGAENPVPYFELIEDLGRKEEGTLYRVLKKLIDPNSLFTFYDQYEVVNYLEDQVTYSGYQLVPRYIGSEWIVRKIYVHHRESDVKGLRFLKFHSSWGELPSQGRPHCFDRAHSNRYAAMALKEFKQMFFIKRRDHSDRMNAIHQKWHHECLSLSIQPVHILQSTGSTYDDEPRWMLCEGITDQFSHRYVLKDNFNNLPMEYQPWTKIIQAFIHYVYDLSDSKTVISNLDCDEHGRLSNVVCFTKNSTPYHSRESSAMADIVNRAFVLFPEQHDCNELCEHLGNIRLK
ncbi:uncharacterized protein MELLADRAFT_93880 [Melampsora larici-populina 98AG31]|uniref:Alpha-type protein kinase domain-containing protein n=1 Tax=Melampsora larici-populina (strain 98AG31 / pathotype 3-4-7) TaxID=747676 RepID=F4S5L4_MELLP|nr:uncharacterized protein MELLADRAFT_93880 [Melampsora larici-populina 98AG31]EGG00089.1 hypothetical protein MELLADRAFT_93880 [Melampsora larici-populina 98AG31]